jgi:hemolysin activation/secretion protein
MRNDTSNRNVTLGGDNGLRGFGTAQLPARESPGDNLIRANLELRSLPLVWQTLHVGFVAFYDVGSVYDRLSSLEVHHAVGLGMRILFSQFNRFSYRADAGVPLEAGPFSYSFAANQAVPLTADEDEALSR